MLDGLLTLLLNLSLELRTLSLGLLRLYFGTFAVALLALVEELSQAWLPYRTLDAQDLLADAFGIAAFSLVRNGHPAWHLFGTSLYGNVDTL